MSMSMRGLGLAILSVSGALSQALEPHSLASLMSASGFVKIPAGSFSMGSTKGNRDELPVRRVRIRAPLEMSKYEVTQAQWDAVMRNPHTTAYTTTGAEPEVNPSHFKGEARPVENVSWPIVQTFIALLNKRDPKYTYRLPTEAEWEYAARAGANDAPVDLDRVAWYKPNSDEETHDVGQKAPNEWGLYDMLGNVFEWVEDWYTPEAYGATSTEATAATPRSYKVFRGCAWLSEPKYCRPAFRMFDFPNQGQYSIGFRLVRTPKKGAR